MILRNISRSTSYLLTLALSIPVAYLIYTMSASFGLFTVDAACLLLPTIVLPLPFLIRASQIKCTWKTLLESLLFMFIVQCLNFHLFKRCISNIPQMSGMVDRFSLFWAPLLPASITQTSLIVTHNLIHTNPIDKAIKLWSLYVIAPVFTIICLFPLCSAISFTPYSWLIVPFVGFLWFIAFFIIYGSDKHSQTSKLVQNNPDMVTN